MKLSLSRLFSPQSSGIGIDISDRSIKTLSLKRANDKLLVDSFGYMKIEEGIVEAGRILAKDKLSQAISDTLEASGLKNLKGKKILLALPESEAFVDNYQLDANLKGRTLEEAVRKASAQNIPFEPENLYFDFCAFEGKDKKQEIYYIASPRETIESYLEVIHSLGMTPLIFETESASLARALAQGEKKDTMILDMGSRSTKIIILNQGRIYTSAIVSLGGNHLTKMIADGLKLSFEEADRIKMSLDVDEKIGDSRIKSILETFCPPILDEIKKNLDYHNERLGRKVEQIILCGGSSLMQGIDRCLEGKIGISVKQVDPWKKWQIAIISENDKIFFRKEASILYATVIGLALRGLDKNPKEAGLNLLDFKGYSL